MNQPKHNNDNNSSVNYNAQTKASLSKITSNSGGNDDEILVERMLMN
ncbi:21059_t:CDS:2 [Entrophospora sp. SA101]|nr:1205_t:CDS:2 [Entrophospora sp. SA101]CAJ0745104.1 15288_t:CDS:2 [Entrophospora sp. SA101]CAJ0756060.1 21059_t:CDS:2 [Entrophospora sp. SA101]CAJ0850892.1 4490_t:CDS:2 [Entrophospora sp. SA101]